MLRYCVTICFLFIALKADYNNITLGQLLKKVALLNNINIVYSDFNSTKRYTLTINNFITAKDLLDLTKLLLKKEGYKLDKINKSFYFVSRIKDKRKSFVYKIKNSNANLILKKLSPIYTGEIFRLNNRFILIKYFSKARLQEILNNIKKVDYTPSAYYVSIDIYTTDTAALNKIGINLNNTNNLQQGLVIQNNMQFLPAILSLLKDNKKSKLIASPKLFLSADTNNTATFKEVTTIPIVQKKTQIIQGTNPIVNNITTTTYKDVGLTLKLKFINATQNNKVKFLLELEDSNIINITQEGITSSARNIKAIIQATINKPVFIAGLSKTTISTHITGVPILKDIPLIKYLFSTKEKTKENRTLVITLTIRKTDG